MSAKALLVVKSSGRGGLRAVWEGLASGFPAPQSPHVVYGNHLLADFLRTSMNQVPPLTRCFEVMKLLSPHDKVPECVLTTHVPFSYW